MAKKKITKKAARKPKKLPTTAERLGAVVKSCRKIMRKDKGLNGDLDRLPMLTWIMFLKFLDDMEQIEESRSKMRKAKFEPSIKPPYRWRDWAAQENGITGPELLSFVTQEKTIRPDGTEGLGLLKYLGSLRNGKGSRRQVIGTVFGGADGSGGITSRMQSGYLLRDVINQVSSINFLEQDELFTLGFLYESMLREMRDAAGDSGEFYTPRPVVRFMVEAINPQLGETVLDPACGTGGFLVEAFTHLSKQANTVARRKTLQEESIFGTEPKSLPYLLCQMNLLLHGVDAPQIVPDIPPEWHKAYDAGVFAKLWQDAATAINHARHMVLIGYSLPPTDVHSTALFRTSIKKAGLKALVVVNPDREARHRTRSVLQRGLNESTKILSFDYLEHFVATHRSVWSV
ncbi:MAG: N-6 DNA methylase [Phycisphaerae bacterium]|nr:N-6 DNA methylase [Phycisphaerae bacterium]